MIGFDDGLVLGRSDNGIVSGDHKGYTPRSAEDGAVPIDVVVVPSSLFDMTV